MHLPGVDCDEAWERVAAQVLALAKAEENRDRPQRLVHGGTAILDRTVTTAGIPHFQPRL